MLLAAGSSSRLGQAKQLLSFKESTLIRQRVTTVNAAFGNEVDLVVVTGARRKEVMAELKGLSFTEANNEEFDKGMSTSIKAGLDLVSKQADAVLILLVDQPFVSEKHLTEIKDKWLANHDKVVAAAYSGILGVPVIFPAQYFKRLQELQGDQGARKILSGLSPSEVLSYPLPEASIDIDTLEDLKAIGL